MIKNYMLGGLICLMLACDGQKQVYTTSLYDPMEEDKLEATRKDPLAFPDGVHIAEDWQYWDADTRRGIKVSLPNFDVRTIIDLPHRIMLPDSPIWYKKTASIQSGVLSIDSDDGCQLWVNDQRIAPIGDGTIFPVEAADDAEIMIRVINNAMKGGLEEVINISQEDWDTYLKAKEAVDQIDLILRKENRLVSPKADISKPIMITDPIWQRDAEGSFYIRWVSEKAGEAVIQGGEVGLFDEEYPVISDTNGVFLFKAPEFDSDVNFKIVQEGAVSKIFTFEKPEESDSVLFAFWGDSQSGWETFRPLVDLMKSYKPEFTVGAGDLVGFGSKRHEYFDLLQTLSKLNVVHYPVPGNHDYDGYYEDLHPTNYHDLLSLPNQQQYFSFRHGNVAFIAIDPNMFFPVSIPDTSKQYQWMMEQLESDFWTSAEWKFITLHQPPFSQGWPGYAGEKSIENLLIPLIDDHKIDGILTGHSHDYERLIKPYGGKDIIFMVSGGGGGGLEPEGLTPEPKMDVVIKEHHFVLIEIEGKTATFKAINLENNVIDQFTLSHN